MSASRALLHAEVHAAGGQDDEGWRWVSKMGKTRRPLVRQLAGARANLRRIRHQIRQYKFGIGVPQHLIKAEQHLRTSVIELGCRLEGNEREDIAVAG
jgi:hypothetical protein